MPKIKPKRLPDLPLFFSVLLLLVFGSVMVYDASLVYAQEAFGGKYYFLIFQFFWVSAALIAALVATYINLAFLKRQARVFFFFCLVLLLVLAVNRVVPSGLLPFYEKFVPKINGAHRWIFLNPKPYPSLPVLGRLGFQPSELAKVGLSLYLAAALSSKGIKKKIPFSMFLATALVSFLILLQPDFGTLVVLVGTFITVFFVSGSRPRNIFLVLVAILAAGSFFVLSSPYRRERLRTYFNSSQTDSLGARYQINQILIAIGSGGLTGLGLGRSLQKYGYVPEVSTDSIFSIVGEEFGFLGAVVLVLAFLYLIHRSVWVLERIEDPFGRFLGSGIIGFLAFQAFLNFFSVTHLLPLTGVPLPLISYGGSSLVVNMFALGIILNLSRRTATAGSVLTKSQGRRRR